MYARSLAVLSSLGLAAAACGPASVEIEMAPGLQTFEGARIIDGTGAPAIENGVLVVRDGRIEAVGAADEVEAPPDSARIDVSGRTIMPGLINAHGHVNDVRGLASDPAFYTEEHVESQLGLYARYGVTTVFSLGGDGPAGVAVRDRQRSDPGLNRARLFLSGNIPTGPTPEEAVEQANAAIELGADILKIRVDDNLGASTKMTPETYRAVIDTAHERGLRLAAHLYYLEDAKGLLDAGADLLAHSVRDTEVDDEFIDQLRESGVCYCPTLMREVSTYVYESRPDWFDDPFFLKEMNDPTVIEYFDDLDTQDRFRTSRTAQIYKAQLEVAKANLKALSDAGIPIAMGTDTGPPGRFQGYFEHRELALMVEAGLTPMQAIVAATSDAARCMQVDADLGTLEPGKRADFLVLGANPLDDIGNTHTLELVYIGGNLVPEA